MESTAYFPKRKCDQCGAAMSPWKPRRRKGNQLVCDGCATTHAATLLPREQQVVDTLMQRHLSRIEREQMQHTAIPAERQPNYDRAHHRFTNPEPAPVGDLHFAYADMMSRMYPGQHAHIMKMLNDQTGAHWPTAASLQGPSNIRVAASDGDDPFTCPSCRRSLLDDPIDGYNTKGGYCPHCGANVAAEREEQRRNPVRYIGSRRIHAHDSGDGETIFHCPFCGSGAVTAGGDGTVSCDYCKTNFTVQVQPEFSAFPQSVDGQPYDVPGMPGAPGADPMADPNADPTADPNADPNANPFDQSGGGDQQAAAEEAAAATQAAEDDLPEFLKKSHFITAQGAALDSDSYLKHLAIRFADDPVDVLAAVRSENNRKG